MPFDALPQNPDLLDLAGGAGQLSLNLDWIRRGLSNAYFDDDCAARAHAVTVAIGTLGKVRESLDRLITEAQLEEARTLLRRALDDDRRGLLYRHWLGQAAAALDRAGLADLVPIIEEAQVRIGGDDSDLRRLLAQIGG